MDTQVIHISTSDYGLEPAELISLCPSKVSSISIRKTSSHDTRRSHSLCIQADGSTFKYVAEWSTLKGEDDTQVLNAARAELVYLIFGDRSLLTAELSKKYNL